MSAGKGEGCAFHFFNPITSNYDSLYVKKVGSTSYEVPDLFFL